MYIQMQDAGHRHLHLALASHGLYVASTIDSNRGVSTHLHLALASHGLRPQVLPRPEAHVVTTSQHLVYMYVIIYMFMYLYTYTHPPTYTNMS